MHQPDYSGVIVWPVSITTLVFSDLILVIDVTLVWKLYSVIPETIALPLNFFNVQYKQFDTVPVAWVRKKTYFLS